MNSRIRNWLHRRAGWECRCCHRWGIVWQDYCRDCAKAHD